ncbi:MAG: hypothetical protein J0L75_12565 [Spirochaetes bacterium]|nr:hypothetical protein [Spirochaetota bacterium]
MNPQRLVASGLYTRLSAPDTGIPLYLLAKRVAPSQQSFYFVNDGMSADGRFLWFYCGFPPSSDRVLGVVDHEAGTVTCYPDTQFLHASPWVEPASGRVYWTSGPVLYRRGPLPQDRVERVNALPAELIGGRPVSHLSTHLTLSADGRNFFVDGKIGTQYVFGTLPLDGGPFTEWHRFDRCHNHAMMSPVDPDAVLFAQENHTDPQTGITIPITNRLWLLRRGEAPRPILREPRAVTHEWWDPAGEHVWCVTGKETWRVRLSDGEVEKIPFPRHCWHSHSSPDGRFLVGDSCEAFFRGCPSTVHFMDRSTGKTVKILDNPGRADHAGQHYHIDPHPRFTAGGRFVHFTTTIRGEVDVALVAVDDLLARTA